MEKSELDVLMEGLYDKNASHAYKNLKLLLAECEKSDAVYPYFDRFTLMMEDDNSYVRTRGLLLIAANAKWDTDNRIDEVIDDYLKHISDVKPITARQCIKVLPDIARYKPDLLECIEDALKKANPGIYADSMCQLVQKDIGDALAEIGR